MKYIYGIFVGLITLVALGWIIHLGLEGKPLAKIKLSEFKSEAEVAQAFAMRLRQEVKDHPIVFLGVDPEEATHLDIWKSFIALNKEPGWQFDEVLVEKNLGLVKALGLGERTLDIKEKETELKYLWQSPEYQKKRIALIVPSVYASQLLKDNPVQRLKSNPNEGRILSISLVPLAPNAESKDIQRIPCVAEGVDYTGQSALGCVIRKKSMFWSKPMKQGVRLGVLEQFGLHDFIAFYRPL